MTAMRIAIYVPASRLRKDPRYRAMVAELSSCELYEIAADEPLKEGTDMLLSVGGDGTFLSACEVAGRSGVPVCGVNFGRLGFLSDCPPDKVAPALLSGKYVIEDREVLASSIDGGPVRYALNEIAVNRIGVAMIGVNVKVGDEALPTYWADGLLVATSSGSTAYSLSVGGPICTPDSRVIIISPIAPHNLNVRPLIVPSSSQITISFQSRDPKVAVSSDIRHETVGRDAVISISVAQFSLRRVRLPETDFIVALKSKLFWGEDVRNGEL